MRSGQSTWPFFMPLSGMTAITRSCSSASVQSEMDSSTGRTSSSALADDSSVLFCFLLTYSSALNSGSSARKPTISGSWLNTSVRLCSSSPSRL